MITYTVQPARKDEMAPLPYPYHVAQDGSVGRQDYWKGDPAELVGFQKDRAVQKVDLFWQDAIADTSKAIGMYAVFAKADGGLYNISNPVESITVNTGVQDGQNRASGSGEGA